MQGSVCLDFGLLKADVWVTIGAPRPRAPQEPLARNHIGSLTLARARSLSPTLSLHGQVDGIAVGEDLAKVKQLILGENGAPVELQLLRSKRYLLVTVRRGKIRRAGTERERRKVTSGVKLSRENARRWVLTFALNCAAAVACWRAGPPLHQDSERVADQKFGR